MGTEGLDSVDKFIKEITDQIAPKVFPKYFQLIYSYEMIMKTLDFIEVINNHLDELTYEGHIKALQKGLNPFITNSLNEYILLEISSFYSNACNFKKKGAPFPDAPDYWELLKDYRNKIVGHRDDEHEFRSGEDWMKLVRQIDAIGRAEAKGDSDSIGTNKVVDDFKVYYEKCKPFIEEEKKKFVN